MFLRNSYCAENIHTVNRLYAADNVDVANENCYFFTTTELRLYAAKQPSPFLILEGIKAGSEKGLSLL